MQSAPGPDAGAASSRGSGDGTTDARRSRQVQVRVIPDSMQLGRRSALGWRALLALLLLLVVFALWWTFSSDARVLERMAPAERAKLFQLTRSKAEAVCAEPGLEDRCREEVELLSEFPECSGDCRTFVARHKPRGSR